jgi:hypothetical protein
MCATKTPSCAWISGGECTRAGARDARGVCVIVGSSSCPNREESVGSAFQAARTASAPRRRGDSRTPSAPGDSAEQETRR